MRKKGDDHTKKSANHRMTLLYVDLNRSSQAGTWKCCEIRTKFPVCGKF